MEGSHHSQEEFFLHVSKAIMIQRLARKYIIRRRLILKDNKRFEAKCIVEKEIQNRDDLWNDNFQKLSFEKQKVLIKNAYKEIKNMIKILYTKENENITLELKYRVLYYLFVPLTNDDNDKYHITPEMASELTRRILQIPISNEHLIGVNGIFYNKPFNGCGRIDFSIYAKWSLSYIKNNLGLTYRIMQYIICNDDFNESYVMYKYIFISYILI